MALTPASDCSLLLIYRPREDERLSWLTYSGRFTHINSYPSAAGLVQDRESSPIRDQRSTTELHRQLSSHSTNVQLIYYLATVNELTEHL